MTRGRATPRSSAARRSTSVPPSEGPPSASTTARSIRCASSGSGLGALYEARNLETAGGVTTSYRTGRLWLGRDAELTVEPGAVLRVAHASEGKSLLVPATLRTWDRRLDAGLETLDAGAYID